MHLVAIGGSDAGISAALRASLTSMRSSAAIMPQRNADSMACFHWFWV